MDTSFLSQFLPGLASTVIGGIALTLIFFLAKEHIFRVPDITGGWRCEQRTSKSDYKPFENMCVEYQILLLQEGERITGDGEKNKEESSTGRRRYDGKHRIPIELKGRIEHLITKPDVIRIHWNEDGTNRRSTTTHELRIRDKDTMAGIFYSTAGNCHGTSIWKRLSSEV